MSMMIIRLGANEDLGVKQNSSKASAYFLHVLLGDIDLIAAVIFLFLPHIDLSQRETTVHIGRIITTEQNNG